MTALCLQNQVPTSSQDLQSLQHPSQTHSRIFGPGPCPVHLNPTVEKPAMWIACSVWTPSGSGTSGSLDMQRFPAGNLHAHLSAWWNSLHPGFNLEDSSSRKPSLTAVVNFMCQLDRTMKCSDTWSSFILDVSVNMFLDEINIWMGRNKQIAHPNLGGPHPICWRPELSKNIDTPASKGHLPLPDCLLARILFFPPAFELELKCSSWVFSLLDFKLELYPQLSWFLS